jgi:hypothetical protein
MLFGNDISRKRAAGERQFFDRGRRLFGGADQAQPSRTGSAAWSGDAGLQCSTSSEPKP